MKRDASIYLQDILKSIEQIEKYLKKSPTKERFYQNTLIQDAVLRRLEIIGEAVRNLPPDFKRKHPEVPWRKISGTRDKLIHQYFRVDVEIVWSVIKRDLPDLKKKIKKLI